jgi:hypothetical protein
MRIEKDNPKIRNPQFEIQNGQDDAFYAHWPCPRATTQAPSIVKLYESIDGGQGVSIKAIKLEIGLSVGRMKILSKW